jgi:hypothetical protein
MARYEYLILSCAQPGREAEFEKWYDEQHIVDVLAVPGVVSARRFHVESQEAVDVEVPAYASMALYEIEADDPQTVLTEILARARTPAMPVTDAMSRPGLVKVLATLSRAIKKD